MPNAPLRAKTSKVTNTVHSTVFQVLYMSEEKETDAVAQKKSVKKTTATKASGIKRKKPQNDDEGDASHDEQSTAKKPSKKSKTSAAGSSSQSGNDGPNDLFAIGLDGDGDESAPIFDSCDQIRRKINQHLIKTSGTKAAFLRDIARAGWPNDPPSIQSKQLADFLTKKGATSGSTSRVYYGAYVYFEKKRLLEKKPKSKHRHDMEAEWGASGIRRDARQHFWCPAGTVPQEDKLGRVRMMPTFAKFA